MEKYNENNFIDHFIGAIPELDEEWIEFKKEWIEEDRIPNYLFIGDMAIYIVEHRDTLDLHKLFQRVEEVVLEGDQYSAEATTVGLLEDLQNVLLHHKLPITSFDEYLGPHSKRLWRQLIGFWKRVAASKKSKQS